MNLFDYFEDTSFLDKKADKDVICILKKPSIFRIKGKDSSKAVLVSTLVHGHEVCGFRAFLHELNSKQEYLFDVYFFVGNVAAAQILPLFSNRLVPGGQNFNRTWVDNPKTEFERTSFELFSFFKKLPLIGVLDLHSFTAHETPAHGFIPDAKPGTLRLTQKLVSNAFVAQGLGALIEQTAQIAPSIVVECGTNGSKEADEFACLALERFFISTGIKEGTNGDIQTEVFVDMTNFKIKPEVTVAWADSKKACDLTIRADVEKLNIKQLNVGEHFGWTKSLDVFTVQNSKGIQRVENWFELRNGVIILKQTVIPNLLATNEKIAKESGFYFFKRMD